MLNKQYHLNFAMVTANQWGFLLLIALPILNALVYVIYINLVDIEWVYASQLVEIHNPQVRQRLLEKQLGRDLLVHWAKLSFWPIMLCQIKILLVAIFTVAIGQFFNAQVKASRLFLMSLWSHITQLVTMVLSVAMLVRSTSPVRIQVSDLNPVSWSSFFKLWEPGMLQFFYSYEGPLVFLNIFILAYLFRHQSATNSVNTVPHVGWMQSILFATLPYLMFLGLEYYLLGIAFST